MYVDEGGTHLQSAVVTFCMFSTTDPTYWRTRLALHQHNQGYPYLHFAEIKSRGPRYRGTAALFADLANPANHTSYAVHILYADRNTAKNVHFGGQEHVMQNHLRAQLIRYRTAKRTLPCDVTLGHWKRRKGDTYFPTTVQDQLQQRAAMGKGPQVQLHEVKTQDCLLVQLADAVGGALYHEALGLNRHGGRALAPKLELARALLPTIRKRIFPWNWTPI